MLALTPVVPVVHTLETTPSPMLFAAEALLPLVRNPGFADAGIRQISIVERGEPQERPYAGGLAPWRLRVVCNYIQTNLAGRLLIADLAAMARLSASHFARAFKASVGVSPHAFITRARIDHAKRLMLETMTPLCEISLICGLADQAHLTRLFRRVEGSSPAAWRRHSLRHAAAVPSTESVFNRSRAG